VANVLLGTFRTGDSSYRFGGEEFLVVLPEQTLESASVAAERLRATVEAMGVPYEGYVPPGTVTISAGVATLAPGEDKTPETLIQEADMALYRAKELGRNRVASYDEIMAEGLGTETPSATRSAGQARHPEHRRSRRRLPGGLLHKSGHHPGRRHPAEGDAAP